MNQPLPSRFGYADDILSAPANGSAVSWGAIFAGSATAAAISLVMLTLGSGLGFAALSPWTGAAPVTAFTVGAGIWLIVTQWVAAALGGYMTGRLRTRWKTLHTHEVHFRDTAHGFLTWAVSTVMVAALASLVALAGAHGAAQAADAASSGAVVLDEARKAASAAALFTGLGMLIGAFIGCVAAALGGLQRDEHP